MPFAVVRLHRLRVVAAMLVAALLTACGGGLFVEFGDGFADAPPDVNLVAPVGPVAPGQTVRLTAAAADDFGIVQVAFFRIDGDGSTALGADGSAPYDVNAQIPAGAVGSVQFFARATDTVGQVTQSETVSVAVAP